METNMPFPNIRDLPSIPANTHIYVPQVFGIATVIKFDDVPDNTVIDSHYPGVTFASITTNPARQWSAYARSVTGAGSAPNVVSLHGPGGGFPAFDAGDGGIQASFASPQLHVSIDACPVIPPEYLAAVTNKPFLQAFDASGTVVQSVDYGPNYGDTNWGSWQTLSISAASAVITKIVFSSHRSSGTHVYGLFDRLVFADKRNAFILG
jgi:hypothetical protein